MKIVFLDKKVGLLGIIWRVVAVMFFIVLLAFCAVGVYFFLEHRHLPQILAQRTQTIQSRNEFLEETIQRLGDIAGDSRLEERLEHYSLFLHSLRLFQGEEAQTDFLSGFTPDGLLEYTYSLLEYFAQVAQNISSSESIFRNTPLVFPFRADTRFVVKRPFSAEEDQLCPFTGALRTRLGVVFGAELQTPVVAPADGVIAGIRDDIYFGRTVRIRHANNYITFYGHLGQVSVRAGQRISRGTQIGTVGQSGWTTGPQLHFAIIRDGVYIDPVLHNFNLLSYSK